MRIEVKGHGALVLALPPGFTTRVTREVIGETEVEIEGPDGLTVVGGVMAVSPEDPGRNQAPALERMARMINATWAGEASIDEPPLASMDTATGRLRHACAMVEGRAGRHAMGSVLAGTGNLLVQVMILAPTCDSPARLALLGALAGARHEAAAPATPASTALPPRVPSSK